MDKLIIDISKYNVIKDWGKVKDAVAGVIIRCGYRGYGSGKIVPDPKFAEFAKQCVNHGIPFGVYFMSQAINPTEGAEEANYAIRMANETGATLPIFIDSEDGDGTARVVRADGLSKRMRTEVVKSFCDTTVRNGKQGGVYASESWFKDNLFYDELTHYLIWCAKYGKNTGKPTGNVKLAKVDMWQYTSKGDVAGVQGDVDVSLCYMGTDTETESSPVVKPEQTISHFKAGANYVTQVNLYVRIKAAGTKKKLNALTPNAKLHAYSDTEGYGILKKGTTVTCKAVQVVNGAVWVQIPSGWVCGITASGEVYLK